jgi:predicted kinase
MSKLCIICGISFAGKSTSGSAIARRFGYAQVDVDDGNHLLQMKRLLFTIMAIKLMSGLQGTSRHNQVYFSPISTASDVV